MIDTLLNIAIDINQWRFETDKTKRLLIMINIIRLANEYYEPEFLEYMMDGDFIDTLEEFTLEFIDMKLKGIIH